MLNIYTDKYIDNESVSNLNVIVLEFPVLLLSTKFYFYICDFIFTTHIHKNFDLNFMLNRIKIQNQYIYSIILSLYITLR